jgi:asparagine synthase (glutamine-hydrolysing)
MCGVCGAVGMESQDNADAIVRRMMNAMEHRGPDAEGYLRAPNAAVGMRRLSIIDIAAGNQPVWNEGGTVAVVFNGEIYNFRQLRVELEGLGHRFATRSDSEVIVHAYESWGEDCVRRFRGMFAFAVVEMPEGAAGGADKVFLARDPLGIKPLYYTRANGALLFASEVRALLASGCVVTRLSTEAISAYLLFGSVSEPVSLVEGVFSLPPGHSMRISPTRPCATYQTQSFWPTDKIANAVSEDKANPRVQGSPASRVRTLLEQAVTRHLIADVPVGVFLSGGLDSTAIATLASRVQAGIHTFTVAFPDLEFSEAEVARQTAKRLGTEHRELTLSSEEMLARLDEAIDGFDQPSMDGINTYFVSWAARQSGLKVALSGLGSDELFGGYSTFQSASTLRQVSRGARFIPRPIRELVAATIAKSKLGGRSPDGAKKALSAWQRSAALPDEYFFTRLLFTPQRFEESAGTLRQNAWPSALWWHWLSDAVDEADSLDGFTKVSWLELRSYLVNTLLRDTDAMSMHHSLEVRVPFLDLPLVECLLSLSGSQKGWRKSPKWLLVQALRDVLPEETVAQRKRTFTFPWDNWLRGALKERVARGLADWTPVLREQIDRQFALDVWQDFLHGRTSWSRPWSLFVLNEWIKRHMASGKADDASLRSAAAVRVA